MIGIHNKKLHILQYSIAFLDINNRFFIFNKKFLMSFYFFFIFSMILFIFDRFYKKKTIEKNLH